MRKLLAVLMAVLMLASVLAVIPAAATEDESDELTYTGDFKGLLISEILHNPHAYENAEGLTVDGDSFAYWELYNAGSEPINLLECSLVRAPLFPANKEPKPSNLYYDVWDIWNTQKKFVHKVDLKAEVVPYEVDKEGNPVYKDGKLVYNATTADGMPVEVPFKLQNSAEKAVLQPNKITVIWLINQSTLDVLNQYMIDKNIASADAFDPREAFIEHYSNQNNGFNAAAADVNILMVWAYKSSNTVDGSAAIDPNFFYDADGSRDEGAVYGIVKNTFDLENDSAVGADGKAADSVLALAPYAGPVDSWKRANSTQSALYVPSNTKPVYYIAERAYDERPLTEAEQADYITAGLADSYLEAGCVHTSAISTPGALDKLQWALAHSVFKEPIPNSISGGQASWAETYLAAEMARIFPAEGELEDANEEEVIKITPPDRKELQAIFFPSDEDQFKEITRLSLVGKILIAVGAVVVAGAGAGAAVIVVKKKKSA